MWSNELMNEKRTAIAANPKMKQSEKKGIKFMGDVADEIKENHLTDEDIEMIVLNLQKALKVYEEIR